jgi:uncharacterized membrane protein YfcA
MTYAMLILGGVLAGVASGLFGIGGGIILVPYMALVLGFSQSAASATSLVALLFPVGILGVWQYYQAGKIDNTHLQYGAVIALTMFLGVWLGAKLAISIEPKILQKLFAALLVVVAARLWWTASY